MRRQTSALEMKRVLILNLPPLDLSYGAAGTNTWYTSRRIFGPEQPCPPDPGAYRFRTTCAQPVHRDVVSEQLESMIAKNFTLTGEIDSGILSTITMTTDLKRVLQALLVLEISEILKVKHLRFVIVKNRVERPSVLP